MNSEQYKQNQYFKRKSKLIISLFFVLCFLFFVFYSYYQIKTPLSKDEIEQTIIIERGKSIKEIAKELEEANLIRGSFYFQFYTFLRNKRNLQAGEYLLSPLMSISQIVEVLTLGKVVRHEVKITIPEGFTVKQIDTRLVEAGLIQPGELISFNVKNLVPNSQFLVSSLEGYLFPDTYIFNKETTIEEIVKKMLDNFNQKLKSLEPEIKRQNKTIFEIITMASILEKEVKTDEDRRIVADIFWKRIEKGQPLESCATIAYILGIDKWRYSYEDTRIESSYNTYLHQGLPPGPINNPGLSAVLAAIYPIKTDYNYFLTEPGNGKTIFGRTLEEHNRNKAKYFYN